MAFRPKRYIFGLFAALFTMTLLAVSSTSAQERADCRMFRSVVLNSSVRYCVFLPASYSTAEAKAQTYPVLYLLHGLGGNEQSAAVSGEWTELQDLRRNKKVGDFLVVAPDGWDTFYINSRDGKTLYGDFFLREFMPFIERTPWEVTERCVLVSLTPNCSVPSARTAPRSCAIRRKA